MLEDSLKPSRLCRVSGRNGGQFTGAERPLASAAVPNLQPFLAVEPAQLLVVHDNAFACKQEVQSPIAEPPANGSQSRSRARTTASSGLLLR